MTRTAGERSTGRIALNAATTFLGGGVGAVLMLGNEVLLARHLGADRYGLYALAIVLARAAELFALFGLRISLLHHIPIHRSAGRADRVAGTVVASLSLSVLLAMVLAGATWLAAPWLATSVFDDARATPYLRALAFAVPLLAASEILGNVGRAFGRASDYVIVRNLVAPATFLALLLTLVALDLPASMAPWAYVASFLVATLVALRLVGGRVLREVRGQRPAYDLRGLYGYAFPVFLNTVCYAVLGWTDILLLGVFRETSEVGVYRACLQFVLMFDLIAVAFNAATANVYPVLASERRLPELRDVYDRTVRWSAAIALLAFVTLLVNAEALLGLLGPAFVAGVAPLALLATGQCNKAALGTSGFFLVISGRQKVETVNAFAAALLNIGLNLALIPRLGLTGAAIATMVSLIALNALRIVQVRRLAGLTTLRPRQVLAGASAIAAGLPCYGLVGVAREAGLGAPALLALGVPVTALAVLAGLWLAGMDPSDRALAARAARALRAKLSGPATPGGA